ncbi:FAD-binding domain-containing protein [Vararia minispora EC-137]|uniref:FAD-binding domain-containing protein n=1 Tax=Vararia minispora EC-137 TaxID=1314806 RepID=A0ACB8QYM6_9AGAM|nr:FAD-binding domain-containing protein [Vararia minispora EC-137]
MFKKALWPTVGAAALAWASPPEARAISDVCSQIASTVSNATIVSYPSSVRYAEDNAHWASSSSQDSACSVRPVTAEDVSTIVKGGGHTTNVGFSSTTGVQIAMSALNAVVLHANESTVDIGAGCLWDDVYEALDGTGVNVVGGRVSGVGMAGFTLGGGYSWKTNQYGFSLDNVVAFELVLPNGVITTVTEDDTDLFFGLRGGFIAHSEANMDAVSAAVAEFSAKVKDPKASILPTYGASAGTPSVFTLIFYDGPTPPNGTFDNLLAIPALFSSVQTQSFHSLITSFPTTNPTAGPRGAFTSVQVMELTPGVIGFIQNLTSTTAGPLLLDHGVSYFSYDVEPFDVGLYTHGSPSAWPPDRSRGLLPINLYFTWSDESKDEEIIGIMTQLAENITSFADAEGQCVGNAALYGNYALGDTPVEDIYGANVAKLRAIKKLVDPYRIMDLAGGFKF